MSTYREFKSRIISYINESKLVQPKDKILVAVSGGMDSMFLLQFLIDLKNELNIQIAVGHINHHIRNNSNDDENFVKQKCTEINVPFYSKDLNYSAKGVGENIEAWAREGRYKNLEKIRKKIKFDKIVTAHHSNDQIETILQRISEKSGISGLKGIHLQKGNVIRPLLSISKKEIESAVKELNIDFIEDETNKDTRLKRNYFRHNVIPQWENLYPNLGDAVQSISDSVKDNDTILKYFFKDLANQIVSKVDVDTRTIDRKQFDKLPTEVKSSFLSYLLDNKSWRRHQWNEANRIILNAKIGKIYKIEEFEILKDRNEWIIRYKLKINFKPVNIEINESINCENVSISIKNVNNLSLNNNRNIELIDKGKIKNKLLLVRKWQDGDAFQPIGLKGSKKVSDYLTDEKLNRFRKESVLVLTADDEIIWICGYRLSEKVKIDNSTKQYLELSINMNVG